MRTNDFDARPDLEFAFFLVEKLGGMTVGELLARMSNWEFVQWMTYYGRRAQEAQLASALSRQRR